MDTGALLIILILALVFSIASENKSKNDIAEFNETLNSWIGVQHGDLIETTGPPSYTSEDGRGGKVLVYDYSTERLTTGKAEYWRNTITYTPPKTIKTKCVIMFWVDSNGYIYQWFWEYGKHRYRSN